MGARFLAVLATIVLLAGCYSDLQVYGKIDRSDRSITVPAGGAGALGEIKAALRQAGWRTTIDRGPTVVRENPGGAQVADTFNTRYRLYVYWRRTDLCLSFDEEGDYDISVIDNRTGSEVLTLSGRGCERSVAQQLVNALG